MLVVGSCQVLGGFGEFREGGDAGADARSEAPVDASVAPDASVTCDDRRRNGGESDVDCGGGCSKCAVGMKCAGPGDCESGTCAEGACAPPVYGSARGPSCVGALVCQGRDCCESIVVPGGTFLMGRSESGTDASSFGFDYEKPEHAASVSTFALDTFEVTVARFRRFVDAYPGPPPAGAGVHPRVPGSGWSEEWNGNMPATRAALQSSLKCSAPYQTWTDEPGDNELRPVSCLSWYEAFAFCAWDGGWLPTEAEWEYAAADGAENALHPWGAATPSGTLASHACAFDGREGCDPRDLPVVGSTPAGNARWGHRDLAGSLWEWNLDWYDQGWYRGGGATCADCANTNATSVRVIRGSSFNHGITGLRAAARGDSAPVNHVNYIGVRCARRP